MNTGHSDTPHVISLHARRVRWLPVKFWSHYEKTSTCADADRMAGELRALAVAHGQVPSDVIVKCERGHDAS